MIGCTCEHVATDPRARCEVRRDPYAHVHTGVPHDQVAHDVRRSCEHADPVYTFGSRRTYVACGFVIGVGNNSYPDMYTLLPVGIPMFLASGKPYMVAAGTRIDAHMDSLMTTPIRATPAHVSKYATWPHTPYNKPIRTRTCVWVMQSRGAMRAVDNPTSFVDLTGIIPPIRHEFGSFERVRDTRYSIAYATRTRVPTGRRRAYVVLTWNEVNRCCSRLRIRGVFTVDEYGSIHVDDRKAYF